jgi:hypothetical protein
MERRGMRASMNIRAAMRVMMIEEWMDLYHFSNRYRELWTDFLDGCGLGILGIGTTPQSEGLRVHPIFFTIVVYVLGRLSCREL